MADYNMIQALLSGVGQVLNEFGGVISTKLTAPLTAAYAGLDPIPATSTTAQVETTYGFPSSGVVWISGERVAYTGKTSTSLTGLSRDDSVLSDYRAGSAVQLESDSLTSLDRARSSMIVDTAEGEFLDVIGRNFGLQRYGLADSAYRGLIKTVAYQRGRGTRNAIGEFLEAVLECEQPPATGTSFFDGAGTPTLSGGDAFPAGIPGLRVRVTGSDGVTRIHRVEKLFASTVAVLSSVKGPDWVAANESYTSENVTWTVVPWDILEDPHERGLIKIRVNCPAALSTTGFAYLNGGETATPSNLTTVTVDHPIRQVLGVWLGNDEQRAGTNYATDNNFAGSTITLNTPLPGLDDVIVDYGAVESPDTTTTGVPGSATGAATAQLMEDVNFVNDGDPVVHPFYLGGRLASIEALTDVITVAGVQAEIETLTY